MNPKNLLKLSAIFMVLFAFIACKPDEPSTNYHDMFIAHGGGEVGGYPKANKIGKNNFSIVGWGEVGGCIKTNSLEGLNTSYKKGFKMFELDLQLTTDNKIVAVHDPINITEKEFLSQRIYGRFTPMNMKMINNWFANHTDAVFVTDKLNRPDLLAEQFKFKDRLIMELFSWETVAEAIDLGVTPMVSQNIFWETPDIETMLDSLNIKIVGMHRDSIKRDKELLKKIKNKGIKTYVWFTKSRIERMKQEEYIWENDMDFCYGMYANSLIKIGKSTDKTEYWEHFIAHAGGAIDGITYTNSLEAMDLSYSKGCRLFELDLVYSTDGKIVANHNPLERTEASFMSKLRYDKYSPMNMESINLWFQNHPDAILITDKINDPERIFEEFLFPNRVIMELFTWKAVDKAIELGIKPMVSENLIFEKSDDKKHLKKIEKKLLKKKIEYICLSRYGRIKDHKDILKRWKKKGIKNYVFHLEAPPPIEGISTEEYVWNYEMDYCYGMYANDLDLLDSLIKNDVHKK